MLRPGNAARAARPSFADRAVAVSRAVALAAAVAACGAPRQISMATTDRAEYPCVLRDPSTLHPDFMVRQTLAVRAVHDGKAIDTELEAVVQKHGDTLLIIGLGPANVKAFTLQQRDARPALPPRADSSSPPRSGAPNSPASNAAGVIEFKQFMGPALPFSPRDMLVDVHRVYFKRLVPPVGDATPDTAVYRGALDGEWVEETWENGELRAAVFTRPADPTLSGAIRIAFGPGCRRGACEPTTVALHNEWFHYRLEIVSGEYERL